MSCGWDQRAFFPASAELLQTAWILRSCFESSWLCLMFSSWCYGSLSPYFWWKVAVGVMFTYRSFLSNVSSAKSTFKASQFHSGFVRQGHNYSCSTQLIFNTSMTTLTYTQGNKHTHTRCFSLCSPWDHLTFNTRHSLQHKHGYKDLNIQTNANKAMVKAHSGRINLQKKKKKKSQSVSLQTGPGEFRRVDQFCDSESQDYQVEASYAGMQTHHVWGK